MKLKTPSDPSSPIEVWLSQVNLQVTCMIVAEDESTRAFHIDSLSMRGAQREITGYLIRQGFQPAGRWEDEQVDGNGDGIETVRKFKPAAVPSVPADVRDRLLGGPEAAAVKVRAVEGRRNGRRT